MKFRQKNGSTWGPWQEISIKALDGMPIASIILFAGDSIPTGWMVCEGATLNEEEYPELYDVIGHTYGGSGLDFKLPNFKGRVPVGINIQDTDFDTLGETGGEKTHTLTVDEIPPHNHSVNYAVNSASGSAQFGYSYSPVGVYGTNNTGGGQAHNILQPYLVVNYIIKVSNTTPTMASVVNATNNSTEDTYGCDYSNKHYGGVVLYNDTTGTTGNIVLSETSANFTYLEIYYRNADNEYDMTKVVNPNGKRASLKSLHYYDNVVYTYMKCLDISGTSMNKNGTYSGGGYYGGAMGVQNNDSIYVVRVVGYK